MNLGYFEDVTIIPKDVQGDDSLKDLEIKVTEKNTGHLSLGLGFSDVENAFGKIGLGQSNFDIAGLKNIFVIQNTAKSN